MSLSSSGARRGRKERRRSDGGFSTVGALYQHFADRLPRDSMATAVREAVTAFLPRDGASIEETRLQLLRKCESSLRLLAEAAAPETAISRTPR